VLKEPRQCDTVNSGGDYKSPATASGMLKLLAGRA
jgi:hypothetical protein